MADPVGTSLSGIRAAHQRVNTTAHNLANSNTQEFRANRTLQSENTGGGTQARVEQTQQSTSVSDELVELTLAKHHANASARVFETALDLQGTLLDIKV